jgi:hypothetical protein
MTILLLLFRLEKGRGGETSKSQYAWLYGHMQTQQAMTWLEFQLCMKI